MDNKWLRILKEYVSNCKNRYCKGSQSLKNYHKMQKAYMACKVNMNYVFLAYNKLIAVDQSRKKNIAH